MASKKQIEERERLRRAKQAERRIQMAGGGIVLLILAVLAFMYFPIGNLPLKSRLPVIHHRQQRCNIVRIRP